MFLFAGSVVAAMQISDPTIVVVLATFFALALCGFIGLPYALIYFIIADEDIKAIAALRKSRVMMKGYKIKFVVLMLSFIGWYIGVVLTFGLLSLYVTPYMNATTANFYYIVKTNYNKNPDPYVEAENLPQ